MTKKFAITDEAVEAWIDDELDGSPIVPTPVLARECALAILNEQREEEELEPLVRCPKEAAETALSYIQDIAKDRVEEFDDQEDDASEDLESSDDEEGDEGKSIIKAKYKSRYRPFKMTCGDELSQLISAHVTIEGHVDRDKLVRFAKINGCWDERYVRMGVGMVRMNVGNRLRAKVRHGHEVIWN